MTDAPAVEPDLSTPAGFFATARKAVVAFGAGFLATEGGLVPALVQDAIAHGFNTGTLLIDISIGIGAGLVAAAAVYRVPNADPTVGE